MRHVTHVYHQTIIHIYSSTQHFRCHTTVGDLVAATWANSSLWILWRSASCYVVCGGIFNILLHWLKFYEVARFLHRVWILVFFTPIFSSLPIFREICVKKSFTYLYTVHHFRMRLKTLCSILAIDNFYVRGSTMIGWKVFTTRINSYFVLYFQEL